MENKPITLKEIQSAFTDEQIRDLIRLQKLYYRLTKGKGLTDDEDEEAKEISERLEAILPVNY